jgi:flavin-dependent thymidylate synthase
LTTQEEIKSDPNYIPLLDYGFAGLIDHMGDDSAIVQAARVSYGDGTKKVSEDRALIRYLLRHHHTSPIEMVVMKLHLKMPIFVARQLVRHRTACLTGDMAITFDLPSGKAGNGAPRAYPLTIKQLYDRFYVRNGVQSCETKRKRIQEMRLRCCDEDNLTVTHTSITDVWENGIKPIIKVVFANGDALRATADHLCFTDQGWLRLSEALEQNVGFARFERELSSLSLQSEYTEEELKTEEWRRIDTCEGFERYSGYDVSNLGRVRSWRNFRWTDVSIPVIKRETRGVAGYSVVSLSADGKSRAFLVHRLVRKAFGFSDGSDQTRHIDNNRRNNRLTNLVGGTSLENNRDRMMTGCSQRLAIVFSQPISFENDGEEMTYDISVEGPFHNFSAANTVVHNSLNEYSGRYSLMSDEFYMPEPEHIQPQSSDNKQGRAGEIDEVSKAGVNWLMKASFEQSHAAYSVLLGERENAEQHYDAYSDESPLLSDTFPGIARELARIVLPVANYTEMYWRIDLSNLFKLLKLRADAHAQYEIRVYADAIFKLIQPIVPAACEAFTDYMMEAASVSRMELALLRELLADAGPGDIAERAKRHGLTKREIAEFQTRFGL